MVRRARDSVAAPDRKAALCAVEWTRAKVAVRHIVALATQTESAGKPPQERDA